ncbi:MAG: hypothetical protein QOG64_2811 [Acidimicrobiaceae bacterium]|nr:hypothetical protein [Acidimicrobiaceae bacterium]
MKPAKILGLFAALVVAGLVLVFVIAQRGDPALDPTAWHLDLSAARPSPDSTVVPVIVSSAGCTGADPDRAPAVSYRTDSIVIRFWGKRTRPGLICTGPGTTTARVVRLRAPLGRRRLVDGQDDAERFPRDEGA